MNNNFSVLLYIDPSTGSMLMSVFIGVFASLLFVFKKLYIKLKYNFGLNNRQITVNKNDKIVIFSDGKRYYNLFMPILRELENRKIKAQYLTFDYDDPILNENLNYVSAKSIGGGNKAFAILNTISASVFLTTTPGVDVYQWKRSKNVNKYVHILHEVGGANEYRMFGLAFFDAALLTGNFQIEEIREIEKLQHSKKKELLVVGSIYMDELQKEYDRYKQKVCDDSVKYVLVAPTWGKNGLLSIYGESLIEALLNTNFNLIIRPHPQSFISDKQIINKIFNRYKDNNRIEFDYEIDNFNSLNKANVMISDYSGVIFDYSLVFNKPVLYFKNEIKNDMNDSWFLDHEIFRYEAMRELGIELNKSDFNNLQNIIYDSITSLELANKRDQIRDIVWQNRGNAVNLVVDYLIKQISE